MNSPENSVDDELKLIVTEKDQDLQSTVISSPSIFTQLVRQVFPNTVGRYTAAMSYYICAQLTQAADISHARAASSFGFFNSVVSVHRGLLIPLGNPINQAYLQQDKETLAQLFVTAHAAGIMPLLFSSMINLSYVLILPLEDVQAQNLVSLYPVKYLPIGAILFFVTGENIFQIM